MGRKILFVEDDRDAAHFVVKGLSEEGHCVEHVVDGRDGLFLASDASYDLIILDRMMPGMNGISLLKAIRAANITTAVLILSALASVDDRIAGLESGADDYLVKPFSFAELIARVNALLRRAATAASDSIETHLTVGTLEIDLLKRAVRREGLLIDLKPREYSLLEYLARHSGRIVSRTMLLEYVWNYHFDPATNVIDVHISRLRRKLDDGFSSTMLHTIRGAGYRLAEA